MKNILTCLVVLFSASAAFSQNTFCNVNGNLMIYTNYDGGPLNIVVDQNIPNLKIGIVSYEAVQVTLSGTFVSNVTAVHYAGYNGTNNHCLTGTAWSISGAPGTATVTNVFAPSVTLSNPNGYGSIICGYSCSITTNQGGCNTIDQIEAYMLSHFPGSVLFAHRVQYGCWTGSQNISVGGNCCATVSALAVTANATDESCAGACDGSVLAGASGGQPPYTITINGGTNFTNLCNGTYNIQVTDALSATVSTTTTVGTSGTLPPVGDHQQDFCGSSTVADLVAGGSSIQWYDSATGGSLLSMSTVLVDNRTYYASQTVGGCESGARLDVLVNVEVANVAIGISGHTLHATAGGLAYQWVDCNNSYAVIPAATNQTFTPSTNGNYAVVITENSCSDTSACVEIVSIGIDDFNSNTNIQVLPNPMTDQLHINGMDELLSYNIRLMNLSGQMQMQRTISGESNLILNVSQLKVGIYSLEVESTAGVFRYKLLKSK